MMVAYSDVYNYTAVRIEELQTTLTNRFLLIYLWEPASAIGHKI